MCPGAALRSEARMRVAFAAAMDATTDRVTWMRSGRKRSTLFVALLKNRLVTYADRNVIHVALDNYTIHTSRQTRQWVQEHGGKLRFHFLPPSSPDDNRIERKVWREMHANVTVNHRCRLIDDLCREVAAWLMAFDRNLSSERESRGQPLCTMSPKRRTAPAIAGRTTSAKRLSIPRNGDVVIDSNRDDPYACVRAMITANTPSTLTLSDLSDHVTAGLIPSVSVLVGKTYRSIKRNGHWWSDRNAALGRWLDWPNDQ